jgi:tetratricopeptide (TPR) repeat protein
VQAALSIESWESVISNLEPQHQHSGVACFLLGHAYLVVNRNNESVCEFLVAGSEEGRERWSRWTEQFEHTHPTRAIAQYLRGDALARLDRWDEALAHFDRALQINPAHPLALNGKGVVLAARGEWDHATLTFDAAAQAAPQFADAYASRGTLYVKRRQAPNGAIKWFDLALQRSPQFSLALNGRGSAEFGVGRWEEAKQDFERARDLSGCTLVATDNLVTVEKFRLDHLARQLETTIASAKPGTQLDVRARDLQQSLNKGRSTLESVRQPADAPLAGMRSAYNRAIASDFAADFLGGAKILVPNIVGKLGTHAVEQGLRRYGQEQIRTAQQLDNQVFNNHLNVLNESIRREPNGPVARAWRERGVTGELMPYHLKNPPPIQNPANGVTSNMSDSHIDVGNWPVHTWFGLGYEVLSPAQ